MAKKTCKQCGETWEARVKKPKKCIHCQSKDWNKKCKKKMRYCDECKFLQPKEHKQSGDKEPHMCVLYGMPVFHNGVHPRIPTPDNCGLSEKDKKRGFGWKKN